MCSSLVKNWLLLLKGKKKGLPKIFSYYARYSVINCQAIWEKYKMLRNKEESECYKKKGERKMEFKDSYRLLWRSKLFWM